MKPLALLALLVCLGGFSACSTDHATTTTTTTTETSTVRAVPAASTTTTVRSNSY